MGDATLQQEALDLDSSPGLPDDAALGQMPILPPLHIRASGLYVYRSRLSLPVTPFPKPRPIPIDPGTPIPIPPPLPDPIPMAVPRADAAEAGLDEGLLWFIQEELRLDVDGQYPQTTASGVLQRGFGVVVRWVARLSAAGANKWLGRIWYKEGATTALPHTEVHISVVRHIFSNQRKATVTFKGGGAPDRTRVLAFASPYFHQVEFEYDNEVGVVPTLSIDTAAHPNRPSSMATGVVTLESVYKRAGFNAMRSLGSSTIPSDGPDPTTTWSDAEMHDAMQSYWSRFKNASQWALWVLFAKQHDMGSNLGGIMFDDIGPNHRQGTAIFTNSFIANAPPGDPAPAAWVQRMMFWTAAHEMGHAFNLAHSWQKNLGTPWIPLAAEPEARSFMNYPYSVSGGQQAFFANFEFRFSDNELMFMRHAPERFVQMGNAVWFDHHGFQGALVDPDSPFELEVSVDRERPVFEFLEPVVLTLSLRNVSEVTQAARADVLQDASHMTVIVKRDGQPARQWSSFARYCKHAKRIDIAPGSDLKESLFAAVGTSGWHLSDPGLYTVQISLEINGYDLVSRPLRVRILPPKTSQEEVIAQDVFTEDAGRVMALDGSRYMEAGNGAWQEVVERLPKSRAAVHARVALALPDARPYRLLRVTRGGAPFDDGPSSKTFEILSSRADAFHKEMAHALMSDRDTAVETLGAEDYKYYGGQYASWLKNGGEEKEAKRVASGLRDVAGPRAA